MTSVNDDGIRRHKEGEVDPETVMLNINLQALIE